MVDLQELRAQFISIFGQEQRGIRSLFAPGRVNLIGEHTDYSGGLVFPAALDVGTWLLIRPRKDGLFRFASTTMERQVERSKEQIVYYKEDDWANYPKGVIRQFLDQGHDLEGYDFLFHGNIPNGAGLSSSASVELATAVAIRQMEKLDYSMVELVQLSQRAENQFVGVNCGIMDQFAVGMGKKEHALLLNCQTLVYQYVPLHLGEYQLVIINTNKRRGLADSKYNERRQECEDGFQILRKHLPSSVTCLGEVTPEQWKQVKKQIASETIGKRLEHVITENDRVVQSQKALEQGDLETFGQLMMASHQSLRDLYEVTGVELDALFEEAKQVQGCLGTRMTGAGFGGCNVSLVHKDAVDQFCQQVAQGYTAKTKLQPSFYFFKIGDGAREIIE